MSNVDVTSINNNNNNNGSEDDEETPYSRNLNNYLREVANIVGSSSTREPYRPLGVQERPKRRWGRFWSKYWCFGSYKSSKRITDAATLLPQNLAPGGAELLDVLPVLPSITEVGRIPAVPPSSPTFQLQSDSPSVIQPNGGLASPSFSINGCSPDRPAQIFSIGPFAYETQLVSPPVLSSYATEPSTAAMTPALDSVQHTTPSSPEVPYAQLLTSPLNRPRRNGGRAPRFTLSHYEFQAYQVYPASPGGHVISPGSAISNSGTSSPFPDKDTVVDIRKGLAPKILRLEQFTARKWGSIVGSGSLTPDGIGVGSRFGSGSVTPDGAWRGSRRGSGSLTPDGAWRGSRLGSGSATPDGTGMGSRLGSGSVTPDGARTGSRLGSGSITPNGVGVGSRIGSGALTPDGAGPGSRVGSGAVTPDGAWGISSMGSGPLVPNGLGPACQDVFLLDYQISEVASLANSESGSRADEPVANHRVSFELTGEDVARCLASKSGRSSRALIEFPEDEVAESKREDAAWSEHPEMTSGKAGEHFYQNHRSVSFGSTKEFNFDNATGDTRDKPEVSTEWWANDKDMGMDVKATKNWSFFPVLQPGVS